MQTCPAFQTFSCCCPSSSLAGKGARFWLLSPGLLPISPENCLARSVWIPARVLDIQSQTFMAQLPMHNALHLQHGDSAVAQLQPSAAGTTVHDMHPYLDAWPLYCHYAHHARCGWHRLQMLLTLVSSAALGTQHPCPWLHPAQCASEWGLQHHRQDETHTAGKGWTQWLTLLVGHEAGFHNFSALCTGILRRSLSDRVLGLLSSVPSLWPTCTPTV